MLRYSFGWKKTAARIEAAVKSPYERRAPATSRLQTIRRGRRPLADAIIAV